MSPQLVIIILAAYFGLLILISILTSKNATNATFFTGNRQSPWYLVAYGMIGATLSGVTFISIPGEVTNSAFSYFQIAIGYLLGYFIIYTVLLPLYYRLNLISIYTYLEKRFGKISYKTGSLIFILSQAMGSSLRLYIAARVLQLAIFDSLHIPFAITVLVTIFLIWVYTFRGGIKTIVWTDTLQTTFMVAAVVMTIILIFNELNLDFKGLLDLYRNHPKATIFVWDIHSKHNFFKQFLTGTFMAVVMTGLDQNMMQKNLTCRSLPEAKKNMFWFSLILVPVNWLFMSLGLMLYLYVNTKGIAVPVRTDDLYPMLALQHFSLAIGILFIVGIIAAAFSSADSSLTALTTAFCIDILNFAGKTEPVRKKLRLRVHVLFSFTMFLIILIFSFINDQSVISTVFVVAGYTYGPLLGLFAFGLFTKFRTKDAAVPILAVASPIISYFLSKNSELLFGGYKFGFELLLVNGIIMFLGLLLFSGGKKYISTETEQAEKLYS